MRRCFAGALLLVMLAQSSGTAVAKTAAGASPIEPGSNAIIASIASAITSSLLFAVATGTEDRYAAMHAPPPHMPRPEHSIDGRAVMRSRKVLHPQPRRGTPERLELPPRSVLTSPNHPRDPRAMRRSTLPGLALRPAESAAPASEPASELMRRLGVNPGSGSLGTTGGGRRSGVKPLTTIAAGTGIHHWWTYEEQAIPGLGKTLLNVGTGNLLVSATDVNIPEQGINLAFQRVYNSQSLHDVNGDDGGDPAIFGNGWTNNFDTNIVYNPNGNGNGNATITVYDLNGTACVYNANNGSWVPCAGEYATLAPVQGNNGCTYTLTKPNGTVYVFQSDGGNTGFCTGQNLVGHLVEILSRNSNNYITFTYSWDTSGIKTSEHITEIDAVHSDGDILKMGFGALPGTSYNELGTITKPDGSKLIYWYDPSGNLVEVDKPGNNSAFSLLGNPHTQWQTGDLPETYAYYSGTSQLKEACGPRCTASIWANNGTSDGGALAFGPYVNAQLTKWQVQGVLNFTPDDSSSTPTVLQSGPPIGWQSWNTTDFQYGSSGPCENGIASNTTSLCDSDGHATIWTTDNNARVTQTQRWVVDSLLPGGWIVTSQTWDAYNNLTATTDANGYTTQYGYDGVGNMVEEQLPNATDFTIQGTPNQSLAPLSFYSYDSNNNVLAYCDPRWTNKKGFNNWQPPSDSLCPSTSGATYFLYNYDQTNEPYGCLTDMYKPLGYHSKIKYGTPTGSDCNNGLPTLVIGDAIAQFGSNPSRQPTQDFSYSAYGQLHTYDRGADGATDHYDSWTLTYDQNGNHDHLNTERDENDSTISGNKMKSFTCYYPDGSVFYTETPSQHDGDGNQQCPSTATLLQGPYAPPAQATAHYYDYDGDEIKTVNFRGCSSNNACGSNTLTGKTKCSSSDGAQPIGTTCKYYDGLDRLVETAQPYDNRSFSGGGKHYEFYTFRWMNRYIYDLSLGGSNLKISDLTGTASGLAAHGNLYKTQEYIPQVNPMRGCLSNTDDCTAPSGDQYSSAGWSDVRGTSFDALDRPVSKYELAFGTNAVTTNYYDGGGQAGQLSYVENAMNQTITYTYDQIARVEKTHFSAGDGDDRSYQYTPDSRIASITGTKFGQISYAYDDDGNELSVTEPTKNGGAYTYDGGSVICYHNYPDGLREFLSIGNATVNCNSIVNGIPANGGISQNNIFSYAYTPDNRLAEQDVNWGYWGNTNPTAKFSWAYAPSGREVSEGDPLTGKKAYYPDSTSTYRQMSAKTYSYDPYGRVNGLTLPGNYQQSTLVYDEDDELAGYQAAMSGNPNGGLTRSMILNGRGEMIQDVSTGDIFGFNAAQAATQSANGAQIGNGDRIGQGGTAYQIPPNSLEYDLRSNMMTCSADPNYGQNGGVAIFPYVFVYDAAGRQYETGHDQTTEGSATCDPTKASQQGNLLTSTYDAENHIINSNIFNASGTAYWGPDGRQRISNVAPPPGEQGNIWETAHWDGDSLLFATSASNPTAPVLYIGKFAIMDYAGDITMLDRDQTGAVASSHGSIANYANSYWSVNGNWVGGWTAGSVRTLTSYKNGDQRQYVLEFLTGTCNAYFNLPVTGNTFVPCPTSLQSTFSMTRSDGYTMVGGIVQGARTFDPTSGQWLTPDPYAGRVADPMSQKPFMWNGNNPMEYDDPSGFDIGYVDPGLVNMLANMINNSSEYRVAFIAMAMDHHFIYNFTMGHPTDLSGKPAPGESDLKGKSFTMMIAPGSTAEEEDEEAGEGGHGNLLATEGFTAFKFDIGQTSMCAPHQGYCNNNEIKAQHFQTGTDAQLGIHCSCPYQENGNNAGPGGPPGAGGTPEIDPLTGFSTNFEQNAQQALQFQNEGEQYVY